MKWSFAFLFLCSLQGTAQVNPQNGAAQFSIPLYTNTDQGNRLSLSASLNYVDGSGLPVSEMASSVGTGWQLDCGGVIQRIQHGEPDDQKMDNPPDFITSTAQYELSYYPNGYLYTTYLPTDQINNGGAYMPYESSLYSATAAVNYKQPPQYLADRDQDVFAFTFNGRSGQFVIGKNGQVVTLVDSKLKVSFQTADMTGQNIRTTINQFTITDEAGIQYIYKDMELGYVCDYTDLRVVNSLNENIYNILPANISLMYKLANNGTGMNVVLGVPDGWFVVNKWYLSAIVNPFTTKQITFQYTMYEEDVNTDQSISAAYPNNNLSVALNATIFWNKYKVKALRLSGVTLSNAEQLNFIYASTPRVDLPHQNTLNQLQVSYKGNIVYSWQFNYGYMVGIDYAVKVPTDSYTSAETDWSRLCLLSVQKVGLLGISQPPYRFSYNLGSSAHPFNLVPPMFSIFKGTGGYYNAIRYLTGPSQEGFMDNYYAPADVNGWIKNSPTTNFLEITGQAQYGILQSVTYPYGGSLSYTYSDNDVIVNGADFAIGGVRVQQTTAYDGVSHTNDVIKQYNYVNSDESTSSGWGGETFSFASTGTSVASGCTSAEAPAGFATQFAKSYVQDQFISGAIINVGEEAVVSEVCDALGQFVVAYMVSAIISSTQSPPTTTTPYTIHVAQAYSSNNPLPWGYARTEVVTLNGSTTAGKVVYTFSNPNNSADVPFQVPNLAVNYSNRPRCAPWAYGLPETITLYDNNGKLVKQTVNHYLFPITTLTNSNFASSSWTTTGGEYGCGVTNTDVTTSYISQDAPYYPITGHVALDHTDEIVYNAPQQSTTTTTTFGYDPNYQLNSKTTTNSKGEAIALHYYHPYDYSGATSGVALMNQSSSNIFSPVISTESYITKSDGTTYLTGASATDYQVAADGDPKPSVTYSFQNPVPVSTTTLHAFNPSSVQRDPNYYNQVESYGYDLNGNAVQAITGRNRITSGLYDYSGQLQVATVGNASYNDIGHTSFEAEGSKSGAKVNAAAIVSSDARTGNNSFNLSDPSNSSNGYFSFSGFNSTLSYIVSFWSKSGSACLTGSRSGSTVFSSCQGASGWKQGETVNGWTYYEVQINNMDAVSASGTGLLDEFRIYPIGAQMKTATYSPLVGKTSECGFDGKVIYYQYDELGRVRYILDDQKNIVRLYDYNYKQ
jgi:hypothetical protein